MRLPAALMYARCGMRDFGLLIVFGGLGWAAWQRPWLGLLALAFVGFLHPQGYATSFMHGVPVFAALFALTALAALRQWRELWPRWRRLLDWRLLGIVTLWSWFAVTAWQGVNPWLAWPKLAEVAKILPPLLLLALLIDSREKLAALLAAIGLALGLAAVKGGYWALMSGFGDRVYGPPGSQFQDNNDFAIAAVMAIPLLVGWLLNVADRRVRAVLAVVVLLAILAVLSSWSRGGVLGLAAMALFVALYGRSRWLGLAAAAGLVAGTVMLFPADWLNRMATVLTPRGEGSALSRLETWQLGWDFLRAHPVFGGGFESWVFATLPNGPPIDWHSAYVEMATEHGLIGIALWLALLLGNLLALGRIGAAARRAGDAQIASWAAMLRASQVGYMVGATFLGIAYWELLYWLLAASGVLAGLAPRGACSRHEATIPQAGQSVAA